MLLRNNSRILPELYTGDRGAHLTAYIPTSYNEKLSPKDQLRGIIWKAEKLLKKEKGMEFTKKFLQPLRRLIRDSNLLSAKGEGGWALFRTENSFRLKRVPIKVPKLSVLAESFHVKPMLKWAQKDKDCYVLYITSSEVHLLDTGLGRMKTIATMPLVDEFYHSYTIDEFSRLQLKLASVEWIEDWVFEQIEDKVKPLVLAGPESLVNTFKVMSQYPKLINKPLILNSETPNSAELSRALHKLLLEVHGRELTKSVKQLKRAELEGKVNYELEKIAPSLISGQVKRLYVAEDVFIWGEINKVTGKITYHSEQKNCSDDDILDDLAEVALSQNAEVVLLPREKMPHKAAIAAIYKKTRFAPESYLPMEKPLDVA